MEQYELIRTAYYRYGKSIRQIAQEFGHHRKTIRRAIKGMEPRYRRQKRINAAVMDPVEGIIDEWLQEDRRQPKKQRHTAQRVYDRLVTEYGFKGASSTVRRWVRKRKADLGIDQKEAMIPLCPEIGKEAEVDWGTAKIVLDGAEKSVKIFCMRSRYSGKIFVQAYPHERQEMFFNGHIRAFAYFGGVHPVLVYDNLTQAVRRVMQGRDREEQKSFIAFRAYYTYEARFCNKGQGHEKGGVEGLVGYARRNFMVPVPQVADFEALNHRLLLGCQQHSLRIRHKDGRSDPIEVFWEAEKGQLGPLPKRPFANLKVKSVRVNPYQVVQVDQNWYSVPSPFTGHRVNVHLECWQVLIYQGTRQIAAHERVFGRRQWCLNPLHYLDTLHRKVGGFDEALPIVQWRRQWPKVYELMLQRLRERKGHSQGTREFIDILKLHQDYPTPRVQQAVQASADSGAWNLESVIQLITAALQPQETTQVQRLDPARFPARFQFTVAQPDLSRYDRLIGQEVTV